MKKTLIALILTVIVAGILASAALAAEPVKVSLAEDGTGVFYIDVAKPPTPYSAIHFKLEVPIDVDITGVTFSAAGTVYPPQEPADDLNKPGRTTKEIHFSLSQTPPRNAFSDALVCTVRVSYKGETDTRLIVFAEYSVGTVGDLNSTDPEDRYTAITTKLSDIGFLLMPYGTGGTEEGKDKDKDEVIPGGTSTGGGGGPAVGIEIPDITAPQSPWAGLMTLDADEHIEDGIVAYDEDGATKFLPFCITIGDTVYFFGNPGVDYYLKPNEKQFSDIEGHWARDNILFTASREVFQGYADGSFGPDGKMTRAMFATVLARMAMADLSGYTSKVFDDVDPGAWYGKEVAWAYDKGIVRGVGDNRFNPGGNITRQEMVLMIDRFLSALQIELLVRDDPGAFSDESAISDWASDAVSKMREYGIVTGKPNNAFDPLGNSTRAEVATVIFRLVESALTNAANEAEAF